MSSSFAFSCSQLEGAAVLLPVPVLLLWLVCCDLLGVLPLHAGLLLVMVAVAAVNISSYTASSSSCSAASTSA
jgi:hypothetical protein